MQEQTIIIFIRLLLIIMLALVSDETVRETNRQKAPLKEVSYNRTK